ncbi:MAG: ThiF family adenylyltransferase [Phycisphaerales bacterium]
MAQTSIPADLARYHRQVILPGFGVEGQRRLAAAHALVVGCGALGTVATDALVRAGVGRVTIVDRDIVEFTNLQRQVLFDESDARAGLPKAQAAADRLARVNSVVEVVPVVADLNSRNVMDLCRTVGVVIDGTDNFQTRYLLNDACVKRTADGEPLALVYGGVVATSGMTLTIVPRATPCLRCIFPDPPPPGISPTCDTAGVLGPMAGVVACIQAAEAIKVLLGRTDLLRPVLSEFDLWNNTRRTIDLATIDRSACPCCSGGRYEFLDSAAEQTASLCGSDSVQVLPSAPTTIDPTEFVERMARAGFAGFSASRFMARGIADGLGLTVFTDGRAIIKGTTDAGRARSIHARFVGG